MTEGSLRNLSLDELFDLMVKSVNELIAFHKSQDQQQMILKSKEVELLQRVIVLKRAEALPHK